MPPPLRATKTTLVKHDLLEETLAREIPRSALVCVDCRDDQDWSLYRYGIYCGVTESMLLIAQDVEPGTFTVPPRHPPVPIPLTRIQRVIVYDKSDCHAYNVDRPGRVIAR